MGIFYKLTLSVMIACIWTVKIVHKHKIGMILRNWNWFKINMSQITLNKWRTSNWFLIGLIIIICKFITSSVSNRFAFFSCLLLHFVSKYSNFNQNMFHIISFIAKLSYNSVFFSVGKLKCWALSCNLFVRNSIQLIHGCGYLSKLLSVRIFFYHHLQ